MKTLRQHNEEVVKKHYPQSAGVICDKRQSDGTHCRGELRVDEYPLGGLAAFAVAERAASAAIAGNFEMQRIRVLCPTCGFRGVMFA